MQCLQRFHNRNSPLKFFLLYSLFSPLKTMAQRWPVAVEADPSLLRENLYFKTSGRTARNRILKSALTELISTYDGKNPKLSGLPTQRLINLYEKFGHGGYGVLLTGNIPVDPWHLEAPHNFILSKEGDTPKRRELTRRLLTAAKSDGALVLGQLTHAGRQTSTICNPTPFSASDVQLEGEIRGVKYGKPIPLSVEQIRTEVVERFAYAAKRLHEAGFDGAELHGAHGYLIAQFLSPTTNHRTDQYGGSVENRVRIVKEIYAAIRKELPANSGFIIGIKINSVEFQNNGLSTDDAVQIASHLDKIGLDFIELSGGTYEKFGFFHEKESTKKREAYFAEFANAIKPHVRNAVVYLTGGLRTVPAMVDAITSGITDGVGLGRPVTAEPDIPNKLLSGKVQAVPISHFENDFMLSLMACLTQMGQAGNNSWDESYGDPTYGIIDLSPEEAATQYKEKLMGFLESSQVELSQGRPTSSIFEYPEPIKARI